MVTIRAHVPVETPAGLLVVLPPDMFGLPPFEWEPPDVFDLAVPCLTCGGGGTDWCDVCEPEHSFGCVTCQASGYVLHGRYRVLDVLPIVGGVDTPGVRSLVLGQRSIAGDSRHIAIAGPPKGGVVEWTWIEPLPAAVPGGVGLIVEQANEGPTE
jgi:hypothetical protein